MENGSVARAILSPWCMPDMTWFDQEADDFRWQGLYVWTLEEMSKGYKDCSANNKLSYINTK